MSNIQWTKGQREAFDERRAELAVSAAAGSGKTAVLIERVRRAALGIVRGMDGNDVTDPAQRVSLDRLLAVTFTRAAAAELRERLGEALSTAAADPAKSGASPAVVRAQLSALSRAQISTIHSFCGEVVRRYGHLRGISHGRVLAEDEAALLRHDLATKYLDEQLGEDASPVLRELALNWGGSDGVGPDDLSRTRFAGGLRKAVLSLLEFRRALPDPDHWYSQHCTWPELDPEHCDPGHPLLAGLTTDFTAWRERVIALDTEALRSALAEKEDAKVIPVLEYRLAVFRDADMEQWDETGRSLRRLLDPSPANASWNYLSGCRTDLRKHPELSALLEQNNTPVKKTTPEWIELLGTPWADVARRENSGMRLCGALWELTAGFSDHYCEYKRARGIADFDDMQRDALAVLAATDDAGRIMRGPDGRVLPSQAAFELRRRFEMVLVDEHQDTNELQDTLIDLVTRDAPTGEGGGGRQRFFVGDLKQSIYTFRQAVPQLFAAARDRLEAAPDDQGRHIKLQQNFRSRPVVLSAINEIFTGLLTPELGGEDYTENELLAPDAAVTAEAGYPPEHRGRPAELHLVDSGVSTDSPGDDQGDDAEAPDRLEAAYTRLALVLREMHANRELIREKAEVFRPVKWRDMAVLMRSTANRLETLLSVFARNGIPAYAAGRSGFYERPEVADALSLLRVIDNPRQDIPLAAVLRGPAVGLCGAQLLNVARGIERSADAPPADLWDRLLAVIENDPGSPLSTRLADFTARLTTWRDMARLAPVPELLWQVYADTGLPAAVAAQPGGEQRLANLNRLHDLARQAAGFERQGLARFLRTLELSRRAAGDLGEAPVLSEAQDVVRILTVHQSKGLEFPVVAIPDIDKRFNTQDLLGDVLWHRRAGIGGRHIDWHAPPADGDPAGEYTVPERHDTLARRNVKAAAAAEGIAEELRVLYVALTRARERLILTGTIDRAKDGSLRLGKDGAEAGRWLDWVANRLAPGISAADGNDDAVSCGTGGCWQVKLSAPRLTAPALAGTEDDAPVELSVEEQRLLLARFNPEYAWSGSRLLNAKLSVTRLAHLAPAPDDADGLVSAVREEPAHQLEPVMPEFLAEGGKRRPTPAEVGTAVHLLMSELDLSAEVDEARIEQVVLRLIDTGRISEAGAAKIKPPHIVLVAGAVQSLFNPGSAKLFPELPVAMLVAGDDSQLLEQLAGAGLTVPQPGTTHPGDNVYIQGVIDLLVIDGDTATVIDYKTDRGADAVELKRRYQQQLEWYCRMVKAMMPDKQVQWVLFGTDIAGIVGPEQTTQS